MPLRGTSFTPTVIKHCHLIVKDFHSTGKSKAYSQSHAVNSLAAVYWVSRKPYPQSVLSPFSNAYKIYFSL